MSTNKVTLPFGLSRLRQMAIMAGPVFLLVAIGLSFALNGDAVTERTGGIDSFFQAYLFGYILWFGIAMGSLVLIFIHHLTGGAWSFVTQRILEASTRTLPLLFVGFLPILAGPLMWFANGPAAGNLYLPWLDLSEAETIVKNKEDYLNAGFWIARALLYFAVWIGLMQIFNRWSKKLDETGDGNIAVNFKRFAPISIILYCLTMTFASTDWAMSLEPAYFSTMYAPLFWTSQVLTALAFATIILSKLAQTKPLAEYVTVDHYHHLGNLIMAFTVLWAYMSFSQYLITWSANLPEEIVYYTARRSSGLAALAMCLMAFHFLVPLLLLLWKRGKRSPNYLTKVCYWILFWRLADVFWFVSPAFHHEAPGLYLKDILVFASAWLGIGGIWLWAFLGQIQKRSALAVNDPRLYEAVTHKQPPEVLDHV
jgi:hypothetical protein